MVKSFQEIIDKQLTISVPIAGFLIIFALFFFIFTDLGFSEVSFKKLLQFRITMAFIILAITLLSLSTWGKKQKNIRILAYLLFIVCGYTVSWLTMMTGGSKSPYWTTIMLTFFGGALLLRLSVLEALALYLTVFGIYVWMLILVEKEFNQSPYFFTSIFGVALAMLVSLAGNWYILYLEKKRYETQKKEYEKTKEIKQQIQLAGEIQQALLPKKFNHSNAEFIYLYKPCMDLGGDLIDYRQLDEKTIGLFICDVSGHGVPAALISSMIKITLTQWPNYKESPSWFLNYLHKELCPILHKNFVTGMVIHVNIETGESKLSSAGHLSAYVLKKNKTIVSLNSKGAMISPLIPHFSADFSFQLDMGDALFLYTDGIIELRNSKKEMFDKERLEKFILEEGSNFDNLSDRLITRLQEFQGSSGEDFPDDISLIGFRRKSNQENEIPKIYTTNPINIPTPQPV